MLESDQLVVELSKYIYEVPLKLQAVAEIVEPRPIAVTNIIIERKIDNVLLESLLTFVFINFNLRF